MSCAYQKYRLQIRMPAALDRADKYLVQSRWYESECQLRKSRIENRKIILASHPLAAEDLGQLIENVDQLIVKLSMFINPPLGGVIDRLVHLLNPLGQSLTNLQDVQKVKNDPGELAGLQRCPFVITAKLLP